LGDQPFEPFPRDEFGTLIRHMPNYARLAWALARDRRLSMARRAAVLAGAAYVLSPIDLVPGIIPVVGQLDDVLIALGVIRLALNGLKPEFRAQVLTNAGLTSGDIDTDFKATTHIAGWIARSGIRLGEKLGSGMVRFLNRNVDQVRSRRTR
jgi:uncharacterized membrane protein YkvA (DUF1232 family)